MDQTKKTVQIYGIGGVVTLLLILLDQFTKQLAVQKLQDQPPFVLIKGVFELHYLENHGAAFGVLQGKRLFFVLITVILMLFLIYVFGKLPLQRRFYPLHGICIVLFAGAVGNFIDRLTHDYVIDFFYLSLIDFPIFNVADIYVTCAVAVFIVMILFYYKEAELDELSQCVLPWKTWKKKQGRKENE